MAQPMWKGQRLLKGMACSPSPRTLSLHPHSDIDTNLDIYIRLKDGIDLDSGELDTELDAELDVELDAGLDIELDSKAKEILKDIAKLEEEGPAKPNYTSYTKKL
ncbi:hypothetical protein V2W45_1331140 [Cenococcum geophilum]